jgi:hypothetical protein
MLAQIVTNVSIRRAEDIIIFVQATKPYRERTGEERRGTGSTRFHTRQVVGK